VVETWTIEVPVPRHFVHIVVVEFQPVKLLLLVDVIVVFREHLLQPALVEDVQDSVMVSVSVSVSVSVVVMMDVLLLFTVGVIHCVVICVWYTVDPGGAEHDDVCALQPSAINVTGTHLVWPKLGDT
jgi:hypothetical protein